MIKEPTLHDILDVLQVLSTQIDARFAQVDSRFEQIDQRFEQIDARFEQIDQRFEQIDARFEQIDQRFAGIDGQIIGIDGRIAEIHDEMLTKKEFHREFDPVRQEVNFVSQQLVHCVTKDYLEGRLAHAH